MDSVCGPVVVVVGVGVDGSRSALDAVRWAAREADLRGVGLRLVDVVAPPRPGDPPAGALLRGTRREEAVAALTTAAIAARGAARGCRIDTEVLTGEPVPSIVAESGRASLVVLGDRDAGGMAALLVGSVGVALAARSRCPVVVVRGGPHDGPVPTRGPVVVGVDGSPEGAGALGFAFAAAAARRVPLVAVHAGSDTVADRLAPPPQGRAAFHDENLTEWLAATAARFPAVPVRRVAVDDGPGRALLERSAGAQLVVVGSRGRGSLTGLVLGSVSQALLHHAPCPVAVVRTAGARG